MSILNIDTPENLYTYLKENIKYGFISKKDNKAYTRDLFKSEQSYRETLFREALLRSPEFTLSHKYGLCYDQIEIIKSWLKSHGYSYKTYYTTYNNHGIIIYYDESNNTYNYIERSIPMNNKIYSSNTESGILYIYQELVKKLENKYINIDLYEYDDISYDIDYYDFITQVKRNNKIISLRK